jgi:uncharacterized protein with FMN-binding domain
LRSTVSRHRAALALLGPVLLAGCGGKKAQQPAQPATVTPHATTAAPTRSTATPTASTARSGTFAGKDVVTRFGDVQISITLKRGHITDVKPLKLPNDRPRSAYISQAAGPILRNEVLNAQSAQINLVSGATYTSDAWATSVQSALDGTT